MHRAVRQPGREELHPCENQHHRHARGAGKSGQNARSFSLAPLPWEIFARLKSPPGGGSPCCRVERERPQLLLRGSGDLELPLPGTARPGAPRTAAVAALCPARLLCLLCTSIRPYTSLYIDGCACVPTDRATAGSRAWGAPAPWFCHGENRPGMVGTETKRARDGVSLYFPHPPGSPCHSPAVSRGTFRRCLRCRAGAARCPPGHGSRSSSRGLCRPRIPTGRSPLSSWRLRGENLAGAPFPAIPDLLQTHLEAASLGGRGALHSQSNYMAGLRGNSLRISKLILIF